MKYPLSVFIALAGMVMLAGIGCSEQNPEVLIRQAVQSASKADFQNASRLADRALMVAPDMGEALMIKAFAEEGLNQSGGNYDDAIAYAKRAVALLPEDYEANHLYGRLLFKAQKSPFDTLAPLQKAYDLKPKAASNAALLAQTLSKTRRYREAWQIYYQLTEDSLYGSKFPVWNELGMTYCRLAERDPANALSIYRSAVGVFEHAAKISNDNPVPLLNLARVYDYHLNDPKAAMNIYQRFLIASRSESYMAEQIKSVRQRFTELKVLERQSQQPPKRTASPRASRRR